MPGPNLKTGRGSHRDDDTATVTKESTTGKGWGTIDAKKRQSEQKKANAGNYPSYEMKLKDGDEARFQFLDDAEPFTLEGHNVNLDGRWVYLPCQKANQKHCTMCDDKNKTTWKAAFKVLDHRGKWDKDKGGYSKKDGPQERLLYASQALALRIKALKEKYGDITKFMWELSRTGSGAKDTAYSLERALDEDNDDRPIRAKEFESQTKPLSVQLRPLTDDELEARGYSSTATSGVTAKPRKAKYKDDDDE
jgi:hypothetical protein